MSRPASRFAHRSPEFEEGESMYSEDAFASSFVQQDGGGGGQEAVKGGGMLTAPPFRFQTHRVRLDWRLLHGMDVERVVRDVDIDALETVVDTIASGDIEAEDTRNFTESNFVKLFRVAQLIVEYLMHIQDTLATHKEHLQTTAYEARRRAELLRIKCRDQKEHLGACRRELRRCKKSLQMYEILLRLRGHTPGDEVHTCHVCQKVFQSEHYLDLHYKRRHPGTAPAPLRGPGAAEDPSHPAEPAVDIAALQNAMLQAQREAMEAREAKGQSDREVAILREQLKAQDLNRQDVRSAIEQVKAAEQQAASATVESVRAAEREAARREQERTVAGLTSELAAARESLRAAEVRGERLERDTAAVRRELEEAQQGEQAAKDALQRERDAVRMPSPKVIQVGAKSSDLGEEGERRLAVAEAQVEALRKEKVQLQAEVEAAQAEAAKLRHDKKALQERLASLESSSQEANAAAEAERRRLVREKVEELERVRRENEEERGKLVADLQATKEAAGVSHAAYDAQRRAEAAREEAARAAKEAEDLAAGRRDPAPRPTPPPPPEPEVRTVTVAVAAKPPSPVPEEEDFVPAGHVPPDVDEPAYGLQAEVEAEKAGAAAGGGGEPRELAAAPAGAEQGEAPPAAPPPRQAFGLAAEAAADDPLPPDAPAAEAAQVSPTTGAELEEEARASEEAREAEAEAAREQARSLADEAAAAANAPVSLHPDEEAQWRREHPNAPMSEKPFAVAKYRHDAELVREWRPDVEVILEDKLARALEEYGIDPEADGLSDRDYAAAMDRLERRRAEMLRAASPAERERMEADRRAVAWHLQHAGELFARGAAPPAHNPPEGRPLPLPPASVVASSVSMDSSFDTPRWGPDPPVAGAPGPAPQASDPTRAAPDPPSSVSAPPAPPPPGAAQPPAEARPPRPTADTAAVARVVDEIADDLESEVAVSQDDPRLRASMATTATDYTEATTATGYTTTSASGYERSSVEVMSSVDSGGSEMFQQMRAQQGAAGRPSRGVVDPDPPSAWGGRGGGVDPSRAAAVAESVESIADSLDESGGGAAAWGGTPTRPSGGARLAPMSGGPVGGGGAGTSSLGGGRPAQLGGATGPSPQPSPSKGDTVIEAFDVGASSTDEERAGTPSPERRPIVGRRVPAAPGGGVTASMASMPSPGGISEVSDVEEIAL